MSVTHADLEARFRKLEDDELLRRSQSGDLTEMAQAVARAEIERRGLKSREPPESPEQLADREDVGHGKLLVVARFFTPTDAYLLKVCLESNGVPAVVADAHLVQANEFLSIAVGGVRVLVPESHFEQALKIRKAFEAGEYQLDDDYDVGQEVK